MSETIEATGAATAAGESGPASASAAPSAPYDWQQALGPAYGQHERLLQAKGWKGPAEALASYAGLEAMIGGDKLALPGKGAPPEAWDKVWERLGRPAKPEGYALEKPPEAAFYSDETAGKFRAAAHQAGLSAAQAGALHDWWLGEMAAGAAAGAEQVAVAEGELARKLELAWGSGRDEKLEGARRAARHFGLGEAQLLKLESLAGDFRLLDGLAAMGALLGEDSLVGRRTESATQAQAQSELRRLEADPEFRRAYVERGHPGHGEAVRRMTELAERANPFAVARAGR